MNIIINEFSGPLDLLLHLIKQADIDIFDININDITNQYLSYIQSMEDLNLNVDSEYLVMAAELIRLKSRELLPHDDDIEEEEDPKEVLINKLLEYQRYKEVVSNFKTLEDERKLMYDKLPSVLNEYKGDDVMISDVTLDDLVKALMAFNEKKDLEKPLNTVVTRKEYSVHKRCLEIKNKLKVNKQMKFEDLFEIKNKSYIVVTFLAILDLARKGKLLIKQDRNLDEIMLYDRDVS